MAEPLKNLYNPSFFEKLIADFQTVEPHFNAKLFKELIFNEEWESMELKTRLRHITQTLHEVVNLPYREALTLFKPIAAKQKQGFEFMFFPDFVELYGLDDWEASMDALEHFTQFSSSEFAIRPFIIKDPERAMKQMFEWSAHPNEHVRRLASEGCRPRLPWAMALPKFKRDPAPILPVLENLKTDPSLYVRRSVANNLNDIAKDHPDWVAKMAESWYGNHPDTDWIVKHACRTLLKQGRLEVLRIFGFGDATNILVGNLQTRTSSIAIGEDLHFSFEMVSSEKGSAKLRLEYAIFYLKANASHSKKIFQITENHFEPGKHSFKRKQSFQNMTTRKHYPGQHFLAIVVNGVEKSRVEFMVK